MTSDDVSNTLVLCSSNCSLLNGVVMDEDDRWIVEHFSELVTKYAGKYIAVVNQALVAVGESGTEVEAKAREIEPHKTPSM